MAIKLKNGKYACGYCKTEFTNPTDAEACKENHNLIYVAISKADLNKLLLFIFSKEDKILPNDLIERLQRYLKNSFDFSITKDK